MSNVLNVITFINIRHLKTYARIGRNCIATDNTFINPEVDLVQPRLDILVRERLAQEMSSMSSMHSQVPPT